MISFRKRSLPAFRFLVFLSLWLVVSGGDPAALLPGLLTAAGATWMSARLAPASGYGPVRLGSAARMVPDFVRSSILGGLDVARRALDPKLPLDPGWLRYRPRQLTPGTARTIFAGEMSLLPGTLIAGFQGDAMLVHCLDRGLPVLSQLRAQEIMFAAAVPDE